MLVEQYAAADGVVLADLDVDALDVLWERAKAALKAH
jgi:hypothetical protein